MALPYPEEPKKVPTTKVDERVGVDRVARMRLLAG